MVNILKSSTLAVKKSERRFKEADTASEWKAKSLMQETVGTHVYEAQILKAPDGSVFYSMAERSLTRNGSRIKSKMMLKKGAEDNVERIDAAIKALENLKRRITR